MNEKTKNSEVFNEFIESTFTFEEREGMFGFLYIDHNNNLWIISLNDKTVKTKVESMDDFYAFLAKQKLGGDA